MRLAWTLRALRPLTVPLAWYEEATALIAARRPASLRLTHGFQTNGLLLNEDWARFFARTGARVGLSIDGPTELYQG